MNEERFRSHARTMRCLRCGHELYWHDGLLPDFACCYMGGWPFVHNGGCTCTVFADHPGMLVTRCQWCRKPLPTEALVTRLFCSHLCGHRAWKARNRERYLERRRANYPAVNARRRAQAAARRGRSAGA